MEENLNVNMWENWLVLFHSPMVEKSVLILKISVENASY